MRELKHTMNLLGPSPERRCLAQKTLNKVPCFLIGRLGAQAPDLIVKSLVLSTKPCAPRMEYHRALRIRIGFWGLV